MYLCQKDIKSQKEFCFTNKRIWMELLKFIISNDDEYLKIKRNGIKAIQIYYRKNYTVTHIIQETLVDFLPVFCSIKDFSKEI